MLLGGDLLPEELGRGGVDWKAGLLTSTQAFFRSIVRGP